MRRLLLSFSHPSQILLVGLLVLSTQLLWAQRALPVATILIQRLDTPAAFARVSGAQTPMHLTDRNSVAFEQTPGKTESRMRLFPVYPRYDPLNTRPTEVNVRSHPAARMVESWGTEKDLGNARIKWLTFAPIYGKVPHGATGPVENLEHYMHSIPWAGSIIVRVGQQVKAHPHITRVLTSLKPRL